MPFTGSHPAAVLPFARTAMPASALVAGSVAPDLPLYLPTPYSAELSHQIVGVLTVDVLAGFLLFALWLVRAVVQKHRPSDGGRNTYRTVDPVPSRGVAYAFGSCCGHTRYDIWPLAWSHQADPVRSMLFFAATRGIDAGLLIILGLAFVARSSRTPR
jgi:hypothetical protein